MTMVARQVSSREWTIEENKSKVISMKISEKDLQEIDNMAAALGCNRSSLLRLLIRMGLTELSVIVSRLDELERERLGYIIEGMQNMAALDQLIYNLRVGSVEEAVRRIREVAYR